MCKRNKIYIISGPSGVGKDTVIKKFSEVNTDVDIITTVTTRKIRKNEKDKIDYIFVNEKEFKKLIESNKLIEWSKVYGNYYGVPKNQIEKGIKHNKKIIIKTDIQGVSKLSKKIKNTETIFLIPPNIQILLERLHSRKTDTTEEIKTRTAIAEHEINQQDKFDYVIVNHEGELSKTLSHLSEIINS